MKMVETLKQRMAPVLQPAWQWFEARDEREQLALKVLAGFLCIALLWLLIWQPIKSARDGARDRWVYAEQTRQWIESNAEAVRQATTGNNTPAAGGDWVGRLNAGAAEHQVSLKGYTPQGDDGVRVLLEDQSLANVLVWLQDLRKQSGVYPSSIEITDGSRQGTVNVRATLERGGG